MSELTDYQRGLKEGRVDALLDEHTARLNKINGSVERHAASVEALTREIREMRAEARLREERVKTAAETLAKETERRRTELADKNAKQAGRWSLRANKATVAYGLVAFVLACYTVYGLFHS